MKLTDKIARNRGGPFFTFEFFPPKTDQGFENLISRISRLGSLKPLAINITWGAGGSTKDRSLELASITQRETGIDTVLHLTCTNMEMGLIDEILRTMKERGIQNILALRGDPPRGQEHWVAADPRFKHGVDLVTYVRSSPEFSSHFCVGVAAYPDGHPSSETNPEDELDHLKTKVDAGADFIVTQLFYDVDHFASWQKRVREKGITIPIIPGIMPLQTYASFVRLTKLCGTKVPSPVTDALEKIKHDDQLVKDYGVTLSTEMIERLVREGDIPGVHLCTLNLEKSVQRVLENLQWISHHPDTHNKLITDTPANASHVPPGEDEHTITPSSALSSAKPHKPSSETEGGRGELNNAATWDEFPNGRFGDFKSPAYGNQDQWGGNSLQHATDQSPWGNPKSEAELTQIFLKYLNSELNTTPFSSGPLSPESFTILPQLERLTKNGLWTVGSQPAVDGARSTDPVFGWGPRGGYVFQKGFVEFFAEEAVAELIERKVEKSEGWVDFFAANALGDCRSNLPEDGRDAVTWGVFPGQEITQTTIIEPESFVSWKDEAFSLWREWASFYPPDSVERRVLDDVWRHRWLITVVHHDYKDPQALWTFLFSESDPVA